MTQKEIAEDIQTAVETLRQGGLILYPTDTIWGIGCDATNEDAVKRVFALKQRSDSKALICLVDNANRLPRYIRNMPDVAWDLMEYTEKPLTLILDNAVIEHDDTIILSERDLQIHLIGENKFICKDASYIPAIYVADRYLYKDLSFDFEHPLWLFI